MDSHNFGSKWLILPVVYSVYFVISVLDGGGKKAGSLHLFSLWSMEIAGCTDYLEGYKISHAINGSALFENNLVLSM